MVLPRQRIVSPEKTRFGENSPSNRSPSYPSSPPPENHLHPSTVCTCICLPAWTIRHSSTHQVRNPSWPFSWVSNVPISLNIAIFPIVWFCFSFSLPPPPQFPIPTIYFTDTCGTAGSDRNLEIPTPIPVRPPKSQKRPTLGGLASSHSWTLTARNPLSRLTSTLALQTHSRGARC